MLESLKSLYGQAFTYYDEEIKNPEDFFWFEEEKGFQFGIRKMAITERELQLLKLQFKTADQLIQPRSKEQDAWAQLLFHGAVSVAQKNLLFFPSFPLYLSFKALPHDLSLFEEAIHGFFSKQPVIIWQDRQAIIMLRHAHDYGLASDLVELLATELFIDCTVLTGAILYEEHLAPQGYNIHHELFQLAKELYPRQRVITLDALIPIYLLKKIPTTDAKILLNKITQALSEGGNELEETLTIFLQNNMNVSTASKALYIHRNSLQYRLDKFTEKTGLDPKTFEDAIIIYIGILKHRLNQLVTFSQGNP
ncbi:hypothetical protein JOD43_003585 [Pullulanibacillus pueri]|uniref:PucR C-terminal helix-turn-helix domain-containing protein n=1 Tax=Pullulanibacillus pueri TaxID=1437324 RepID=A0A8J2ZZB9_9BACL|nr:helix-turn-helix domain-containing protein [Pullulanibacillus pueri]MBM7683405.1 hypothetical protein [Pullulanibacillus pueri]GGH88030.1 hypothetical protein GCM10007096_39410 [Pullulanibacillus pueri]